MKREELRPRLIEATVQVIAREGLDKASTKQIGLTASLNEAYIYRCFADKEDMFAKAFAFLDEELVGKATTHVSVMAMPELSFEMRCWAFFTAIWRFMLGNREKCLAYIRYYYSPYFAKNSAAEHKKRYAPLVEKFRPAFQEKANVWMILNHILNTMMDFAVKVYDGAVADDADTAEHVFRLVYMSTQQYFKKEA